tara:strand:- start:8194 stop:11631 length:3438 start_codon:yes stop_codon:yes gene_type:complete
MAEKTFTFEEISDFLEGGDPQKHIVAIEATYADKTAKVIVNDPDSGKRIEEYNFEPFIWLKEEVSGLIYDGSPAKTKAAMERFGVRITPLKTSFGDNEGPERMENGYKFIAKCKNNYATLLHFFKNGGVDVWGEDTRKLFVAFNPVEQYMIQSGKRLFKGFEEYDDIHRLQFDLETKGLYPEEHPIFQIGIKDNRGYQEILETTGDTPQQRRDSEIQNIIRFFEIINEIKPDTISGYFSEDFDWPFFEKRCELSGINMKDIAITLFPKSKLRRGDSTLKLGQDTEYYTQTFMWGYNILDISHSVKRAMAINSDIKKVGLKYITKFSGVAKPNRVYVPGNMIYKTWKDPRDFWYNDTNGEWGLVEKLKGDIPENYEVLRGKNIIDKYLIDDLWETEEVDKIYNQASYLIAKLLPTSYMRSSTMGTATQWKLIMAAWSYDKGIGIPATQPKKSFTGGLARLLEVGYAEDVYKLDFAALYPKIELTWDIFPDLDISGVMKGLLTYIVDTRDEFKNLMNKRKARHKELVSKLAENRDTLDAETIAKVERAIIKHKKLASDYDKKQMPLKILANSWFGAYGAPYIFNWGETDCAEETTCRGRQYLRLMVKVFKEQYGFRPLVGDTDGFNFAVPKTMYDYKYTCKASHWKTEQYEPNTELIGFDAMLAEFNETYMIGRMGLDLDDVCKSTINFARKNYANDIGGKIKLVGNSIKSKAMPIYIEEFIDEGIPLLLSNKGSKFIELYNQTVDRIFEYKVPIAKIASKSKVKVTYKHYKNVYCKETNKAGRFKNRQAHMELIGKHDLKVNMGDIIHYVNIGSAKSHPDIKKVTDKETGEFRIDFNCELIPQDQLDYNPDLLVDNYNVAKYLEAFNKRIHPLLVCFNEDIREKILIKLVTDRKTKVVKLVDRNAFTEKECELISGKPFKETDQDAYEHLMTMEDKEIIFWDRVDKVPNNMEEAEWTDIRDDWKTRVAQERLDSIQRETDLIIDVCKHLEVPDFVQVNQHNELPAELTSFCHVDDIDGVFYLFSNKWKVRLHEFNIFFKYEEIAKERQTFYNTIGEVKSPVELYNLWVEHTKDTPTQQVVKMASEVVSKDIRPPKVVRDGVVKKMNEETKVEIKAKIEADKVERVSPKKLIKSSDEMKKEVDEWNF